LLAIVYGVLDSASKADRALGPDKATNRLFIRWSGRVLDSSPQGKTLPVERVPPAPIRPARRRQRPRRRQSDRQFAGQFVLPARGRNTGFQPRSLGP